MQLHLQHDFFQSQLYIAPLATALHFFIARGSRHYFLCICHWICSEQHTRKVQNTVQGCLRCAVSVPTVLTIRRSSHHRGISSRTGPAPHAICRRSRVKKRRTGPILGSQTTNHQVYCLKAGKPRAVQSSKTSPRCHVSIKLYMLAQGLDLVYVWTMHNTRIINKPYFSYL